MKIKIVVTGIGNRSLPNQPESSNWDGWVEQIHKSNHFELVAVHDTSEISLITLDGNEIPISQLYDILSKVEKSQINIVEVKLE